MKMIFKLFWQKKFTFFFLFLVVFYLLFSLTFDIILKKKIEKEATKKNGATVSLNSLSTSFIWGNLTIKETQWTDPQKRDMNLFELEKFFVNFNYLPLLKKRFIFDEISFHNFQLGTKKLRISQNDSTPKLKEKKSFTFDSINFNHLFEKNKKLIDKSIKKFKVRLKEKKENWEKQKKELEKKYSKRKSNLEKKINALKTELDSLKKEFNTKIHQNKNLQDYEFFLKKIDNFKKNKETIENELNQIEKDYQTSNANLKKEIKDFSKIDQEIKQEILEGLGISNFNTSSILEVILGPGISSKINNIVHYIETIKKYLPEKQDLTYEKKKFKDPNALPQYLVKKISLVSSQRKANSLSGQLTTVSSDLSYAPIENDLKLLNNDINYNLKGKVFLKDKNLIINQKINTTFFPIKNFKIGESQFTSSPQEGKVKISGSINSDTLRTKITFSLIGKNITFPIKENINKSIKEILKNTLTKIEILYIEGNLIKTTEKINLKITSNLDSVLQKKLGNYIQKKTLEQKKNFEKLYAKNLERIKKEYKVNLSILDLNFSDLKNNLEDQKKEINKIKKTLEKKIKESVLPKLPGIKIPKLF